MDEQSLEQYYAQQEQSNLKENVNQFDVLYKN